MIGSSKPAVCYVPYAGSSGSLILSEYDSDKPEDYVLLNSSNKDDLGLGQEARKAHAEIIQEMAKEDRRVENFSVTAQQCESFSNNLDPRRYNPGLSYDRCMSDRGYPFGIFSAMSTRSNIEIAEMFMLGSRTLQQCSC